MEAKPKLLVVDDDLLTRQDVVEAISEHCEVLEAADGMQAILLSLKHDPECILLEVMLPDLGGFLVCEILKQIRRTQQIPIIITAARDPSGNLSMAMESGASGFLSKPFSAEDLRSCVLDILNKKSVLKRQFPRIVMAMPIRIEGETDETPFRIHTLTEDVSRTGLRFFGDLLVRPGDLVRISVLGESKGEEPAFAGTARIIWVNDRYAPLLRCGARFEAITSHWVVPS